MFVDEDDKKIYKKAMKPPIGNKKRKVNKTKKNTSNLDDSSSQATD